MTTSIPIWVRVSVIIALVLVGAVVSSLLLGASGRAGGGSGSHEGNRDRGSQMEGIDHSGSQVGQAVPSGSARSQNPAPCGDQTPAEEDAPPDGPDDLTATPEPTNNPRDGDSTPAPSHGSGDHTRSDGSRGH